MRETLCELAAEVLARKQARDAGKLANSADVRAWRPYADEVLALFNVDRQSFDGGITWSVVLTLAPMVPASADHSAKPLVLPESASEAGEVAE